MNRFAGIFLLFSVCLLGCLFTLADLPALASAARLTLPEEQARHLLGVRDIEEKDSEYFGYSEPSSARGFFQFQKRGVLPVLTVDERWQFEMGRFQPEAREEGYKQVLSYSPYSKQARASDLSSNMFANIMFLPLQKSAIVTPYIGGGFRINKASKNATWDTLLKEDAVHLNGAAGFDVNLHPSLVISLRYQRSQEQWLHREMSEEEYVQLRLLYLF